MQWRALIVIGVGAATGCSGSGRPIEYVVPDGYTGRVWVLLDPEAPDLPVVNGRYRVMFPASGVFRVKSMSPFEHWHEASARYEHGRSLPTDLLSGSSQVAPATMGMWSGTRGSTWPDQRDYIVWVVGTEEDFKALGVNHLAPPESR
jgi:hypothetical protein